MKRLFLLEADSLWKDGKYDLVILDVSFPDGTVRSSAVFIIKKRRKK